MLKMTEEECKNKISSMGWDNLRNLWKQIMDCYTPEWDSGKAFEYYVSCKDV